MVWVGRAWGDGPERMGMIMRIVSSSAGGAAGALGAADGAGTAAPCGSASCGGCAGRCGAWGGGKTGCADGVWDHDFERIGRVNSSVPSSMGGKTGVRGAGAGAGTVAAQGTAGRGGCAGRGGAGAGGDTGGAGGTWDHDSERIGRVNSSVPSSIGGTVTGCEFGARRC